MRRLRSLHTYLGVFFAPLLLFFVVTGGYQTVDTERLKSPSDAETVVQKLRVVHTDQIYPKTGALHQKASPTAFKALVIAMSVGIGITLVLGLVLAFRFARSLVAVSAALVLGTVVPIGLLWIATRLH